MRKCFCLISLLGFVAACTSRITASESNQANQSRKVEPAPEWDALFDRNSGWTGSDGTYSIPLSGFDAPSGPVDQQTLFVFGDAFIGQVDENKARHDAAIVRNTTALLETVRPAPEQITFHWETDEQGQPASIFESDTPESSPDEWIWPMDGLVLKDRINILALRMQTRPKVAFEVVGITHISFTLDNEQNITAYEHVDTPLYYRNEKAGYEIVLGQAIMPMTEESGNPNPDGYIYIYGPKSYIGVKKVVVARVWPQDFHDFSKWRYWDGEDWGTEIENSASLTGGVSQEFSVTPLQDGRFLLVFQIDDQVAIRFAESPTGPFGPVERIYDCPQVGMDKGVFVYNAKAHPHLSAPGEMLISYNVNSTDWDVLFMNADSYRPRFIKLHLSED
ncbi:MAG: DUF4185 domain-containing protein [Chloroflexota bacterium]|nr:DUF4185 domain-containing protein [Chloroflexota bacterium]